MNIGTLIATLGVDTMGLHRAKMEMQKFETQMQASTARINAQLRTTGKSMQMVGRSMTKYMTLPLALIGGAAFKMSMDFEASLSKVVGLVGVAREQVDAWGKEIIKMAPQLGKAPKELADALFFITSAGIRGAEAMDVLNMSAKASVAGLGETKVVADLVTSAMNAYGIANLNAAQATDILAATVREGKAEADALASAMGMVLPLASEMSVRFDEVGASVAAMTRTGTSATTASMQLRQILAALKKPTKEAEKAFVTMETSAAELRKTIREDGLLAALMKIRELTKKYGETVVGKVIPNIRAMSGFLDIMGKNLEDNVKIYKALENATGALNKAFEAAAATAKHKWNVAIASGKTALTVLGKTISEQLTPILTALSEKIQNLITWFNNLSEVQKALIVKIGGLLLVVGPLITLFGFITTSILPMFVGGIMAVVKAFGILKLAMLANPLAAMLVGLTAIITAYVVWNRNMREVSASQRALNAVSVTANRSIVSEKVALEQLMRVVKSDNTSKEEKRLAIEKINKISPEYLGYITQEMVKTGQAQVAIDSYIDSLLEKATIEAAYNKLVEVSEKRIDAVMKKEDRRITMWQAMGLNLQWLIDKQGANDRAERLRTQNAVAYGKEQTEVQEELANIIEGTARSNESLTKSYKGVEQQMKFVSEMDLKQASSLKTRIVKQIELQKKYTVNYEKELAKRVANDAVLQKLSGIKQTESIKWAIGLRTEKIRKEIALENEGHAEQLANMEKFAVQVNKIIEGMGGVVTVAGVTKVLEGDLALIKEQTKHAKEQGDVYDANAERVAAYGRAIESLKVMEGVDPAVIKRFADEMERLKNIKIDPISLAVKEVTTDFTKQIKDVTTWAKAQALLGNEFELSAEKQKLAMAALQAYIVAGASASEAIEKVDKVMGEYGKTLTELIPKIDVSPAVKAATDAWKAELEAIDTMVKVKKELGEAFDVNKERYAIHHTRLLVLAKDWEANEKEINKLIITMRLLKEEMSPSKDVMKDISEELVKMARKAVIFGESFNIVSAEIDLLLEKHEQFKAMDTSLYTEEDLLAIQAIIDRLVELGYTFEDFVFKGDILRMFIGQMTSAFYGMGAAIGGSTGNWLKWVGSLLGSIPKIIKALMALNIVKHKESIAGVTAAGAKLPFPMNIAAIAAGVAAVIAAFATMPKMEKGGIIPPGFPNDSFPAMLSSGEKVIPLGADIGSNKVDVNVTVEGVQRGEDLYYIVKEVERKLNNSYG